MLIAEVYNIPLKETASDSATSSAVMASIAMPMFTGRKGIAHHVAAKQTIDPMGHIF